MATRRRSEVNWTASRSRSRRVPKSIPPVQPCRPRIRAQSSQPRRPGQSVQPGPGPSRTRPAHPSRSRRSGSWRRRDRRAARAHGLVAGAPGFLAEPPGLLVHPPGRLGAWPLAAGRRAARRQARALARHAARLPGHARGPLSAGILTGLPRLLAGLFLGLPGLLARLVAGLPGLLAHVGGHLPAHPAGLTGRPGQLLAQAAHGLPDVFPDLADDVADRRGQFLLELVELVAAAAQFLAAGLGDPVDLAAVDLVVGDQALFLEPGQPGVDRAGGGRVHAHEPVAQQPDNLVAVPGLLIEEPEQVQPEAAMAEYRTQLASPSISFSLSGCWRLRHAARRVAAA